MGPNNSSAGGEYGSLLRDFEVVRQVESEGLFFMKNNKNGGEYLLRELTFNDRKQFDKWLHIFERRKEQLVNCKFVVPLERIVTKTEDQYCSTFYKIYALFQFTDRTLEAQINERKAQKRRFQETELWSILASCILGLSHLQRNAIKHDSLRSNSVLISRDGVVKVYDPITTGCQSNYETLCTRRSTPHIYLSPELTEALQQESSHNGGINTYKSDIFTLGLIILEAGLSQYQDECYRDDSSRIHWETVQYNIHRFKQIYSEDLTALIEVMLVKDEKERPDWIELEERVIKEEESKTNNFIGLTQKQITNEKTPKVSNATSKLVQSQTSSISQDSNTQRHTHLYRPKHNPPNYPPPPLMTTSTPPPPHPYFPTSAQPIQPRYACIAASNINVTRPLRSIFPNSTYATTTRVDENLIVVPQQERFSQSDTPNNRNHSSYFDSNMKSGFSSSIPTGYPQQQQFANSFSPSPVIVRQEPAPPQVNTYGVSFFASEPARLSTSNQAEYVVERYKQGSEYKGYKQQGMRHGQGTFYYQDGGMYEGEWRFNKMEGRGKLFYQSGKLAYEGNWHNDQFSGRGVLYNEYPDVLHQPLNYKNLDEVDEFWTKYEGEFKEDLKCGRGVLFLSNGQYYEGEFEDDAANGKGTYYQTNGNRIVGSWLKSVFVG